MVIVTSTSGKAHDPEKIEFKRARKIVINRRMRRARESQARKLERRLARENK